MAEEYSSDDSLAQPVTASPVPAKPSVIQTIFLGPNGIRAGWRLLIFVFVVFLVSRGVSFTIRHTPAVRDFLNSQPRNEFTPTSLIVTEGLQALLLFACVGIMALIEKRTMADYGLPLNQAFGLRFWQGVPLGFVMLSLLLAMIAALHGFSLDGVAVGGPLALKYGALYFIGFIIVGFFEEFSFRGYLQSTLGSGIGFWPAAILLSILFGAVHLGNPGEAKIGAFMAGSFGLVCAFALWRTGNLWLPIGMHASWDWGETYFYGTPDSGLLAQGHFLNSAQHGPAWLSGGSVGPEGSWLVFAILIILAISIHFLFPSKARSTA
jgi:uncharacterized protein